MFDRIFYHGSKTGLKGDIEPLSNPNSDFGRGFYLGTDLISAIQRASIGKNGKVYALKINLDEHITSCVLEGNKWLFTLLAFRDYSNKKDSSLFYNIRDRLSRYDFLIGKIADDDFSQAFKEFSENSITDICLSKLLSCVDLGMQYVATTKKSMSCN
ncbi:MAG: DUF3990 domain-containing protein [Lachnospiraceae bacterium]|nr:DUF3990 domain-containing protein [Lachnospiraceae bacterium]